MLVGGLGYRNLRDHSLGALACDRLRGRSWPEGVAVEDLSYSPIAFVQRLQDEPAERRFQRAVVVAGVPRPGRTPATVEAYRWDGVLPGPERVQAAVGEGLTGVISLDNTLIVARHFQVLPGEVLVVEVEPAQEEFGEELSPQVQAVFGRVCDLVAALATEEGAGRRLPEMPLGGGRRLPAAAP